MARPKAEPRVYSMPGKSSLYLSYYDASGRLVRETSGTSSESEAWIRLAEKLKAVEDEVTGRVKPDLSDAPLKIDGGVALFFELNPTLKPRTVERYLTSWRVWEAWLATNEYSDFRQLTKSAFQEFIQFRRRQNVKDPTILRDLNFMSSVWSNLIEHPDWEAQMPHWPMTRIQKKKVKNSKDRLRFAHPSEWQALLDACNRKLHRDILTFAVETGLRDQELCGLVHMAIIPNEENGRLEIHIDPTLMNVKDSDKRIVPLSDDAIACYKCIPVHNTSPFVFWYGTGKRLNRNADWWGWVRNRAKVKNFRFHDIRHTFAQRFLQRTGDIAALSKILGHSDLSTTQKYAEALTSQLHERIETFSAKAKNSNSVLADKADEDISAGS